VLKAPQQRLTRVAVNGLRLIVPDNTTTLANYVNTYPGSSLNSNHWVGSNQIGGVVDTNLKVIGTNNLVGPASLAVQNLADSPPVHRRCFDRALAPHRQPSRCDHVRVRAGCREDPCALRRALRGAFVSFLCQSFIMYLYPFIRVAAQFIPWESQTTLKDWGAFTKSLRRARPPQSVF
jgi:hypothetical protein